MIRCRSPCPMGWWGSTRHLGPVHSTVRCTWQRPKHTNDAIEQLYQDSLLGATEILDSGIYTDTCQSSW